MTESDQPREADREAPSSSRPRVIGMEWAVVGLFCLVFALLVIGFARRASPTYDETTHLPAGYTYLACNDYRLSPEHPPLSKKWAALPLLWGRTWPSPAELSGTEGKEISLSWLRRSWARSFGEDRMHWFFGHLMLYGVADHALERAGVRDPFLLPAGMPLARDDFFNQPDELIFRGRMMILLLGLILALLVYLWARDLYGITGGFIALALYCFDSNFIAHSGLVTTDLAIVLFNFGAVYFFWRACRSWSFFNALLTGLFFGAAQVTKFSGVLLIPVFVLLGMIMIFSRVPWSTVAGNPILTWTGKARRFVVLMSLCALLAYAIIWTIYGFRFTAAANPGVAAELEQFHLGDEGKGRSLFGRLDLDSVLKRTAAAKALRRDWDWKQNPAGPRESEIQALIPSVPRRLADHCLLFAMRHQILPEAFIYGFAFTEGLTLGRESFLLGKYSHRGFWQYFPISFLLKTPLITLLAITGALILLCRGGLSARARGEPGESNTGSMRRWLWAFLLVPPVFYLFVSMTVGLNIGHRHLLPIYPFLFVACGALAAIWRSWSAGKRKVGAAMGLILIGLSPLIVFAPLGKPTIVYPHCLAYFNELAGGPRRGYERMVDSSLDWGQDLKGLKQWLEAKNITEPINLCYFGTADPRYYGIRYIKMPGGYFFEPPYDDNWMDFSGAKIPGYLAISATHMQGTWFSPELQAKWKQVLSHAVLVDAIGYSLFIYRVDRPLP